MESLVQAKGINGQVELYEHFLLITRKGLMSFIGHGFDGGKFILLKAITAIQYKAPGKATSGFIQFAFQGCVESKKGLFDATTDENTVIFGHDQQEAFQMLLNRVIEKTAN